MADSTSYNWIEKTWRGKDGVVRPDGFFACESCGFTISQLRDKYGMPRGQHDCGQHIARTVHES